MTVPNTASKPVNCSFCTFQTQKVSQARLHFLTHHKMTETVFKCEDCHLSFYSAKAKTVHSQVCRRHKKEADDDSILEKLNDDLKSTNIVEKLTSVPKASFTIRLFKPVLLPQNKAPTSSMFPIAKDSESSNSILPDLIEVCPSAFPESLCVICCLPSSRNTSFDLNNQLFASCIGCGRNVNGQMKRKCEICEKSYTMRAIVQHYKSIHADRPLVTCSVQFCDRKFLSDSAMLQRLWDTSPKNFFQTDVCQEVFFQQRTLPKNFFSNNGHFPTRTFSQKGHLPRRTFSKG